MPQKSVDEHLPRLRHGNAVQRFAQRADQHDLPESVNRRLWLPMLGEPLRKCLIFQRGIAGLGERSQTAGDGPLVRPREIRQPAKRPGEVQRARPVRRREFIDPAAGTDEIQLPFAAKIVREARRPHKMGKVRATAHRDVLAVIDVGVRRRIVKRTGPAAKPGPRFQQRRRNPPLGQRGGRRQASESAPDNHDPPFRAQFCHPPHRSLAISHAFVAATSYSPVRGTSGTGATHESMIRIDS